MSVSSRLLGMVDAALGLPPLVQVKLLDPRLAEENVELRKRVAELERRIDRNRTIALDAIAERQLRVDQLVEQGNERNGYIDRLRDQIRQLEAIVRLHKADVKRPS